MRRTIHWLGAGLSSVPGIQAVAERCAKANEDLVVWNRTVQKAIEAIEEFKSKKIQARAYSKETLASALNAGDVVVSMLPAVFHPEIAEICLKFKAHLVTTSYVSDAMKALDARARELGLSFINEAGLDPGIDHLFARDLMQEYRQSAKFSNANELEFESLCGGFPEKPGTFCYKFSWSPLGVLRALKNKAQYIKDGAATVAVLPWKDLFLYQYGNETFEAYPNRDSLAYLEEYGFDAKGAGVKRFIRGTLRPQGWSKAWEKVFDRVENGTDAELTTLSDDLWTRYRYTESEKDRVVLIVELKAISHGKVVWSGRRSLNEYGMGRHTAMARTVSLPASLAVESILEGRAPAGVSGAPTDASESKRWFEALARYDILVRV